MTTPQPPAQPPAGWYPAPHANGEQRYWDGTTWTEAAPPAAPVKPKKSRRGAKIAWSIVGGVVVLIVLISVISNLAGGGTPTAANTPAANVASTAPSVAPKPQATQAQAAAQATAGQAQALTAAQGYLTDGQGFSKASLLKQLTSSYGNGFSKADAEWAIAHSGANWDQQAVIAAKGYMSDGQGFSRSSLINQLTSSYANEFTKAQAEYAANKVGLK